MNTDKYVLCKCGRPARRSLNLNVSYSDADGKGNGAAYYGSDCCHRAWCLVKAGLRNLFFLIINEMSRVNKFGRNNDSFIYKNNDCLVE